MDNIYIRLAPLPYSVKAAIMEDEDGGYNIYINQSLAWEQQIAALVHELKHIRKKHFDRTISRSQAEQEAR